MFNIQFALIFPKVEYFLSFTIETGLFYNHFTHNYHPSLQFFGSVHSVVSNGLQYARLSCPSPTPRACSNSCPSSQWYHSTISSSVVPFSTCLQSFPASGSFPMSQFFASGGQSIGASVSASVLPMDIQDWFPLGLTVWSPCSPRDSQEFSNTTVQKHQFFGFQPSPGHLPDPGLNPHLLCLLHCRWILCPLSLWGSLYVNLCTMRLLLIIYPLDPEVKRC